jgi:predicted esterase
MTISTFAARPTHRPARSSEAATGLHRILLASNQPRPALMRVPAAWQPDKPAPLAIMLHGSGGNPEQALELLQPYAEAAGAIVVAIASQDYTWDGVLGYIGPDYDMIDGTLQWVFDRYPIDPGHLAIGGFSDGASYALAVVLANGNLFSHGIALSPGFVPQAGQQGKPLVFISHGTADQVLPITRCSRRIVPALQHRAYAVRYREFDGGHEIPSAIAFEAVQWWLAGPDH